MDVTGLTVLDSGLSTGGFADCLLQRGAAHVYGVDVGYGQARMPLKPNIGRAYAQISCHGVWNLITGRPLKLKS